MKKAKKVALSIGYIFKFCMGNTFKSKKWWLENSDWKFEANKAKNITFEENWGQIFAPVRSKMDTWLLITTEVS